MVTQNFEKGHNAQIHRQNLFRTKYKKAAVAFLTHRLTTVKRGHHSREFSFWTKFKVLEIVKPTTRLKVYFESHFVQVTLASSAT